MRNVEYAKTPELKSYYSTKQLALLVGVNTRTIRQWQQRGCIPVAETTNSHGWNMWSGVQARAILKWRLQSLAEGKQVGGDGKIRPTKLRKMLDIANQTGQT